MTLVYLIHSLHGSGGMERVLSVKASYLAEHYGHEVHIVTASLKGRKPFFAISPKVRIHDLGTGDSFGPALRRYAGNLRPLLASLRPDVTISMGGNDIYVLGNMADCGAKVSEFHFSHDKFLVKYGHLPFGRAYADYRIHKFEKAARKMDRLVVLTREDLREWKNLVPSAVQIYNPLTVSGAVKSSLEKNRFIAVGRLMPQKNYSSMVRAWLKVSGKHPDWSLDIYGEGPLKEDIAKQIESLGLSDSVHLMGIDRNIAACMADSSGLVLSSLHEGFPLVLVEAASCGLPLVSYDCPRGPSEMVSDGENGFLVPVGDEDGLARGICRIIENEELRRSMGEASFRISRNFSPESIMAQWNELFKTLI